MRLLFVFGQLLSIKSAAADKTAQKRPPGFKSPCDPEILLFGALA